MNYNIEPFHFGIEDITASFPSDFKCIEKYFNNKSMIGIMIDDTGFDQIPYYKKEIEIWLENYRFKNCLILNELKLQPIAVQLISKLPQNYINDNPTYINIKLPELKKPILLAKKNKDSKLKPSCAILTLSWYLLRLSTSFFNWSEAIQSNKNKIINDCNNHIKNDSLIFHNVIINYLPKVFEKNEENVLQLFCNLSWNNRGVKIENILKTYFY